MRTSDLIPRRPKGKKIRIGYFSADFRCHPVAFLTAELFELHDRSHFEVYAFSLTKSADSMRDQLLQAFDHFINADGMSDLAIAQMARDLGIDIAIDLTGLTQNARFGIFSCRAAPIQVNWLGYPGTIGAQFIDYIIADKIIIPDSHRRFYSEKVLLMPHTYIVDDSRRVSSSKIFTKKECGLPENKFIFCCFNNDYKFNPPVLDAWSKILLEVKDSVLWISENSQSFKANMAAEFSKRGIHPGRIIFAPKLELMSDHLARYYLADLFIDTYPYNAHTTALDSLKCGIPLLTLIGETFSGRVAASLLNAIGLPELISNTVEEYVALAVELAKSPNKLALVRKKLIENRNNAPLFNTALFARNIEAGYVQIMERYWAGQEADHLTIRSS